jgi:hypothetical protein
MVIVTPRPRFTPGERTPGIHWTGGRVGPRAGLDTEDRDRGSNPSRPVCSQTLYWLSYHCSENQYKVPSQCDKAKACQRISNSSRGTMLITVCIFRELKSRERLMDTKCMCVWITILEASVEGSIRICKKNLPNNSGLIWSHMLSASWNW